MEFSSIMVIGFVTAAVVFGLMILCICLICYRNYRQRAAYTQPHYQGVTIQPLPPTHPPYQGVNVQPAPAGETVISINYCAAEINDYSSDCLF